jgi:hypothetical protein
MASAVAPIGLGGCRKRESEQRRQVPFPKRTPSRFQAKRLGTFEESAKAFVMWLEGKRFNASVTEVKEFKAAVSFELDPQLYAVALELAAGRLENDTLVKDGQILGWSPGQMAFLGNIRKSGKVRKYEVYSVGEVFGLRMQRIAGIGANRLSDVKRIVLFERSIENETLLTRHNASQVLMRMLPRQLGEELTRLITADRITAAEIDRFNDAVAKVRPLRKEILKRVIIAFRLMPDGKGSGTAEGRKKDMDQVRLCSLIHELTHSEMGSVITLPEQEEFCFLAEIAYCPRPLPRLGAALVQRNTASMGMHRTAFDRIIGNFRDKGITEEKLISSVREKDVRKAALKILDDISRKKLKKPFSEVVDVSLFKEGKAFAESVQ